MLSQRKNILLLAVFQPLQITNLDRLQLLLELIQNQTGIFGLLIGLPSEPPEIPTVLLLGQKHHFAIFLYPGLHVETLLHTVPDELLEFRHVESRKEELGNSEFDQTSVLRTNVSGQRFARLDHGFLAESLVGF